MPSIDEIADRQPLETADKRSEARLATVKVHALAKPIGRLDAGDERLARIDLPRVDVKDVGHPGAQDRTHALNPQRVGNEPEIAAPTPRNPAFAESDARHTRFLEAIAERNDRLT